MNKKGYTLVEIIIVIGIISILFLISILPLATYTKKDIDNYAKEVASDLLWARFSAISEGIYYKIEFWPGNDSKEWEYRIRNESESKALKEVNFTRGVRIINVNFPGWGTDLYFYPNGAPSSGGTVTIQSKNGNIIYIKIEAAVGRIRVVK